MTDFHKFGGKSPRSFKEIKWSCHLPSTAEKNWIREIVAAGGVDISIPKAHKGGATRMTNRPQIINLSIHPTILALSLPLPEGTVEPFESSGVVFCTKYAGYWILPSLLLKVEPRGISWLRLAYLFSSSFSSSLFIVFSSFAFREEAWYIYMVNRQQFVHRRNNISDRDQREVVEENWRNWERQWTK